MVLELKTAERFSDMEAKCEEAMQQIEDRNYVESLMDDGYRPVLKYGICFFKKGCRIIGK